MASTPRLQVGTIFAEDYRIVGPLAEGGMGSVYRAEQLSTHKPRAVKVVHGRLLDDERSRMRFVREATVAASIASEHVVEVIAAGIDRATELPYLVMELLDGGDLAAVVRHRGRLTCAEVGALMRQLCHGLGAAHAARVIHRDLKPENVFVAHPRHAGTAFTVKILDFGIAKVAQESKTVATLTGTVGSPLWMSPEQINNEALGPQTDIWALGLLAFWALTGQSYWRTARAERLTIQALFAEQLFRPLEPAKERAAEFAMADHIPPGFDDWFMHCVTRQPGDRFADAAAAWAAFEQAVDSGMRPDVTLLPPLGEVWDSTSSRMRVVGESTLADRGAVDSAGMSETGVGTTFGGVATVARTNAELPTPAAVPVVGVSTEFAAPPVRTRARWLPFALAPVAIAAIGTTAWLALRPRPDGRAVAHDLDATPPEPPVDATPDPPLGQPGPPDEIDVEPPPLLPEPPLPTDAKERAAVAVVRPMTTQTSFSAAAQEFMGWSADGSRFVIDATYPDHGTTVTATNRLRLVEVHDALSGMMVDSFLVEREADASIPERDRLARAAAEAEPYDDWPTLRQELALGHAAASSLPPSGLARLELAIAPTPAGSEISTEATSSGFAFRWVVGPAIAGETSPAPRIVLRWSSGAERWELLDVPMSITAEVLRERAEALRPPDAQILAPVYAGTIALHWSPGAERVVVVIRAALEPAGPDAPRDDSTIDQRWFLRASGPQIRLVDAGAGQRKLRHAAWSLQAAGFPIAAADLDHENVETSRTYVRLRDAAAADLAAKINRALGTELPSALLDRAGWTQIVVMLGPDFQPADVGHPDPG